MVASRAYTMSSGSPQVPPAAVARCTTASMSAQTETSASPTLPAPLTANQCPRASPSDLAQLRADRSPDSHPRSAQRHRGRNAPVPPAGRSRRWTTRAHLLADADGTPSGMVIGLCGHWMLAEAAELVAPRLGVRGLGADARARDGGVAAAVAVHPLIVGRPPVALSLFLGSWRPAGFQTRENDDHGAAGRFR